MFITFLLPILWRKILKGEVKLIIFSKTILIIVIIMIIIMFVAMFRPEVSKNIERAVVNEYKNLMITICIIITFVGSFMLLKNCYLIYGLKGIIVGYIPSIILDAIN